MSKRKEIADRTQWSAISLIALVLLVVAFTDANLSSDVCLLLGVFWGGLTWVSKQYIKDESDKPSEARK